MKKCGLLTCNDLTDFVTDDQLLLEALKTDAKNKIQFEFVSWQAVCDWNDYNWIIVRSTWDYTKHLNKFLSVISQIDNSRCQLFNSAQTIRWNSHKSYLKDLQAKGIAVIPLEFVSDHSLESLQDAVNLWNSEKIVLKPTVGANSNNIEVLDRSEAVEIVSPAASTNQWFVQPFLKEIFEGELSLHFFADQFSHGVRKVPKRGDFRVQEEHGATILPYKPSDQEIKFAQDILAKIDEDLLYARVDYVMYKDVPHLMELELIEPSLYFRTDTESAHRLAHVFLERVDAFI